MIKIENVEVWGFEHAIRGMRNPMNSWDKGDSGYGIDGEDEDVFVVGKNDISLMRKLYTASLKCNFAHRKFLRQIFVSMDITAPLYWWKEFDTYKVGTVAISCSTMHTIHKKEFEINDFSCEHLINGTSKIMLQGILDLMNQYRNQYLATNNKDYWWQMIQLLPSSYNQKRTVTMNYENVINILNQRTGHKLDEWIRFCDTISELPYVEEILFNPLIDEIK